MTFRWHGNSFPLPDRDGLHLVCATDALVMRNEDGCAWEEPRTTFGYFKAAIARDSHGVRVFLAIATGKLDKKGHAQVKRPLPGIFVVTFPDLDGADWDGDGALALPPEENRSEASRHTVKQGEVVVTDVNGIGGVAHHAPVSSVMFVTHGNQDGQAAPYTFVDWNEGKQEYEDRATDVRWELEDVATKATQAGLSRFGLLVLYGCKLGDLGMASRRRRVAEDNKITIAAWPDLMNWQEVEREEQPVAAGKKKRSKTPRELAKEKKERMVGTGLVSANKDGSNPQHPALLKPPIVVGRLDEIDGDPAWDLLVDCEKTIVNLAREAGLDVALEGRTPNKRRAK